MTSTYQPELTWQSELFASSSIALADPTASASAHGRQRLSPRAAFQELLFERAFLVDIRPADQRTAEGEIAPGLHTAPIATPGLRIILLCQDGYASSVAAESLLRLGASNASDVIGGFAAWRALGLPIRD